MIFINLYFILQSITFIPEPGDLLFQDIDCGPMCDAIEAVTTGINNTCISHIGLVVKKNDNLFVLEAISDGVILTPINDFLYRSLDKQGNPKVIAGRVRPEYIHLIPYVLENAMTYLGKPYDDEFIPDNGSYYCSELMYLLFKSPNGDADFFTLEPMTFKTPGSDSFFPVWEEYYKKLGRKIPEGVPGINPGLISRSDKIVIVHSYGELNKK